jgi:hypothetical protein
MFRPHFGAAIAIACLGASSAHEQLGLDDHAANNPFKTFFKGFSSKEHVNKGEKFLKSEHTEEAKGHKNAAKSSHNEKEDSMSHAIKKVNSHKGLSSDSSLNAQLDEIAQSTVSSSKVHHKRQKAQSEAVKVEMKATHRVCDPQDEGCTSMCKWLKMTDREINGQCPLFEWQLKSCDYTPPDQRVAGTEPEPIDCAVDLMRTNVLEGDVPNYINQLDVCIEGLPTKVNATCYVGLGLLRSEIGDWKAEAALKDDAEVLRQEIGNVTGIAKEALQTKTNEQAAIDKLTGVLSKAEQLPGHYLVDEVHTARGYLDVLGPIPAVRKQLKAAMLDGKEAFKTTSLYRVKEAMVWLHVAVNKGVRFKLDEPVPTAKVTLQRLGALKDALIDLKRASFQGNVSYVTQSNVPEAVVRLRGAIAAATAAGLENKMPIASDLLSKLEVLEAAVVATANATAIGQSIVRTPGAKTIDRLTDAVSGLNTTVSRDVALGLSDNATTLGGVATLDQLLYIKHAREALTKSKEYAKKELYSKGSVLNDDGEEAALDVLGPAVEWGEEVGLVKGMASAKSLLAQLARVEKAKENMAQSLELGNATIKSKSFIKQAIESLTDSIAGSEAANTTAGVATAKEQIAMLEAIKAARIALSKAGIAANRSQEARTGYDEAIDGLNSSIVAGAEAGLVAETAIARERLKTLKTFKKSDKDLGVALRKQAPSRGRPQPRPLEDKEPNLIFNRTGLKVQDLPAVPNAVDDGDNDFDEHIAALVDAIASAKKKGLVDPEMKSQLETVRAQKRSYALIKVAVAKGGDALEKKRGIEDAITTLYSALEEASEMSMTLGVGKAQNLLAKLNIIQPARDELKAAILQANVSMHTVSGMDAGLVRLNAAIELNRKLELFAVIPSAERVRDELMLVKKTYVAVKAAIMQGQLALKAEEGEEAAIAELNTAIENADKIDLHKGLPIAVDLLHELMHMNAQHQQLQAAMDPGRGR